VGVIDRPPRYNVCSALSNPRAKSIAWVILDGERWDVGARRARFDLIRNVVELCLRHLFPSSKCDFHVVPDRGWRGACGCGGYDLLRVGGVRVVNTDRIGSKHYVLELIRVLDRYRGGTVSGSELGKPVLDVVRIVRLPREVAKTWAGDCIIVSRQDMYGMNLST